jgi:hypothetical protein
MAALLGGPLSPAIAQVADDTTAPWDLGVAVQVGHPFGYVKVGENQYPGTALFFHGTLGVDTYETLDSTFRYHFTDTDAVRIGLQMLFLDGSARLSDDVFFNGTKLVGGTTVSTDTNFPDFFRATAMYERYLYPLGGRGEITGSVGLTYVGLNFKLNGTVAPDTPRNEPKEDFITQELPIPLLGLRATYPIRDDLQMVWDVDGGYLPFVDSGRTEGGTVELTQSHFDTMAGVRYFTAPHLSIEGGVQFSYFVQHEVSGEDDNYIQLSMLGGIVGVRYVF